MKQHLRMHSITWEVFGVISVMSVILLSRLSVWHTPHLHQHETPPEDYAIYTYHQASDPLNFRFEDDEGCWSASVDDHTSVFGSQHSPFGPNTGLCSEKQFINIFDRSLTSFRAARPSASSKPVVPYMLVMRMNVIMPLWRRILGGVRHTLSRMPGRVDGSDSDHVYFAAEDSVDAVLHRSPEVTQIVRDMRQKGIVVTEVDMVDFLVFKSSLSGHTWSELSSRPDAGLEYPGLIEFDLARAPQTVRPSPVTTLPAASQGAAPGRSGAVGLLPAPAGEFSANPQYRAILQAEALFL